MFTFRTAVARDDLCLTVEVEWIDGGPDYTGVVILVEEDEVGSDVSKWNVGDVVKFTAQEVEAMRPDYYEQLRNNPDCDFWGCPGWPH